MKLNSGLHLTGNLVLFPFRLNFSPNLNISLKVETLWNLRGLNFFFFFLFDALFQVLFELKDLTHSVSFFLKHLYQVIVKKTNMSQTSSSSASYRGTKGRGRGWWRGWRARGGNFNQRGSRGRVLLYVVKVQKQNIL